jgi:hypothetical protein
MSQKIIEDLSLCPQVRTHGYFVVFSSRESRSRIHKRKISLRFLGIILRVLRLEVSIYNVQHWKAAVSSNFCSGGGGGGKIL